MKTASSLEGRLNFKDIDWRGDLDRQIINAVELDELDDWEGVEDYLENDVSETFAQVLRMGSGEKWDYVTFEPWLNDDYEPEGYVALFCSETISGACCDVVNLEIRVNSRGDIIGADFAGKLKE